MVNRRHSSMVLHPLDLPSKMADWLLGIAAVVLVLTRHCAFAIGRAPIDWTADFEAREGLLAKLLMIRGSQRIMKMCRRGINHLRLFSRELVNSYAFSPSVM